MKLNNLLIKNNILSKEFYNRDTVKVARDLIGKVLVRRIENSLIAGIISETEAYKSSDPASHCYYKIGITDRNRIMYGPVGCSYVYLSYGIHCCLNLTARDVKFSLAGGVLLRAVIPIEGLDLIEKFRNTKSKKIKKENLTNGPGKLTQAFHINFDQKNLDVTDTRSDIFVLDNYNMINFNIKTTARIGISKAVEQPWRFILCYD